MDKIVVDKYKNMFCKFDDLEEISQKEWNNKNKTMIAIWDNDIGEYRYYRLKTAEVHDNPPNGCGKVFQTDLIHRDGSKDILVCTCGGDDGLCKSCSENHDKAKSQHTKTSNAVQDRNLGNAVMERKGKNKVADTPRVSSNAQNKSGKEDE